jgi:putative acyl-CoA dehydrogenase
MDALDGELAELARQEGQARRLVERLALAISASLLLRHAPDAVADAFVGSRLAGPWAGHFGALPPGVDAAAIARRAVPEPR